MPFLFLVYALMLPLTAQAPIELGEWMTTTSFANPRTAHAGDAYGGRLYVLGGYFYSPGNFIRYRDVQFAEIRADHRLNPWQETKPFEGERSGPGLAFHAGFIYLTGGDGTGGALGDVQFARLAEDGGIVQWVTSPHRLNTPRSNHASLVVGHESGQAYLYVIAGVGQMGKDTVHYDTVEFAPLAADGSPGPWQTGHFHMKGGRSAPGVFEREHRLYVLGGWGDLLIEDVFDDIQYTRFEADGQLQPWHTSPYRLKMPLYGHVALVAPPRRVLVLGGNAGEGNYFGNIQESTLAADGAPGDFAFTRSQVPVPRWGHRAALAADHLYVWGGAARTGFLDSVMFAPIVVNKP